MKLNDENDEAYNMQVIKVTRKHSTSQVHTHSAKYIFYLPNEALLGLLAANHLGRNTAHLKGDDAPIFHHKLRWAHSDILHLAGDR